MRLSTEALGKILEKLTFIIIIIAFLTIITLPLILRIYMDRVYPVYEGSLYVKMLVFSYISGIICTFILILGYKILRLINLGDPFIKETAVNMRKIAYACLFMSAQSVASMFFIDSMLMFICFFIFGFLSAVIFLISDLFKKAVKFKEENELTI